MIGGKEEADSKEARLGDNFQLAGYQFQSDERTRALSQFVKLEEQQQRQQCNLQQNGKQQQNEKQQQTEKQDQQNEKQLPEPLGQQLQPRSQQVQQAAIHQQSLQGQQQQQRSLDAGANFNFSSGAASALNAQASVASLPGPPTAQEILSLHSHEAMAQNAPYQQAASASFLFPMANQRGDDSLQSLRSANNFLPLSAKTRRASCDNIRSSDPRADANSSARRVSHDSLTDIMQPELLSDPHFMGLFANNANAAANSNLNFASLPSIPNNSNPNDNFGGMHKDSLFSNSDYSTPQTLQNLPFRTCYMDEPLLIPPKKSTKSKHKKTFAEKLMHVLSVDECKEAIRWVPAGNAFCVVNPALLVKDVLPKYFKEAKYTSFTRKLNRWGFKHLALPGEDTSIYSHEKFLRDQPELCKDMDGGHKKKTDPSTREGGLFQGTPYQGIQQNQFFDMSSGGVSSDNNLLNFNINGASFNSMVQSHQNSLMGSQSAPPTFQNLSEPAPPHGMRRTSLGYMPYAPSRRDSGFGGAGSFSTQNDSGFIMSSAASSLSNANVNSNVGREQFRKASLSGMFQGDSNYTNGDQRRQPTSSNVHEDLRQSQAKLAVLEDMIAKERRKQSLLSNLDPDPVKNFPNFL